MAQILDGLKISKDIKKEIKADVEKIVASGKRPPHLAAVLVGNNGASMTYVNNKIKELNNDPEVDGFIVQLPLPKQMDQEKVIMAINSHKDVDGFHPENFGRMALEMSTFLPATPFGILTLLERYHIETKGKNCVIIGRSRIVGRPMSILMGRKDFPGNATVTVTHSYTPHIEEFTKNADIVITALGDPKFLKSDMIKEGAVIVDVGITRVDDNSEKGYHLEGDVDFESCAPKASWITPVPGGVGPMTRAMLLKNTILAYKHTIYKD
jgi:methylenetetrahydrofolate dehydrogenase (NADP+)/methenyltetrahydrofolate cyclohydrolase